MSRLEYGAAESTPTYANLTTSNPARALLARPAFWQLLLLLLHVPLGWFYVQMPRLATYHSVVMLGVGFLCLLPRSPVHFVAVCAYIAAAEMPWRATEAFLSFEFSKYALIALLPFAIIRYRRLLTVDWLALAYFGVLIPGIFVRANFDRRAVIFNLAGPLVLALATAFLSTVEIRWRHWRHVLVWMIAPMILQLIWSVLNARVFLAAGRIRFGNDSNPWLAGGEGPNQVSTLLGLGVALCLLYAIMRRREIGFRLLLFVLSIAFTAQAFATFSRGGVVVAIGTLGVAGFYLLRLRRYRGPFLLGTVLMALIFFTVVFPQLNTLTQGTLETRFTSTTLTGRDVIIQSNVQLFLDNPLLGVGVGVTDELSGTPHTEFTRLLAEHGLLGVVAIGLIGAMVARRVWRDELALNKAVAVALTAWAIATTLHSATRLAIVGFIFGLGAACFELSADEEETA